MFGNLKYNFIKLIRLVAVLFGVGLFIISFLNVIVEPNCTSMPTSKIQRLWINLPFIGFAGLLIIPYKKIKNPWLFYMIFLGLILYIIELVCLNLKNQFQTPFIIIIIFYIINFWAFLRITNRFKLFGDNTK